MVHTQNILVVGGAGFIGSHMVLALKRAGFTPIVLDNLSKGHRQAVQDAEIIVGDLADNELLEHVFSHYSIAAVMHFASFIEVAESVQKPHLYYQNNVVNTLLLLQAMVKYHVKFFIFSSSAAVYGEPLYTPINEDHPLNPINPYGRSKRMVEEMVHDFARSSGLKFAILRYFNAAGADPNAQLTECHHPESHLIPILLQAASGLNKHVTIYGEDYPTSDGSCVRDYIHVMDLVDAHLLVYEALQQGRDNMTFNLGAGIGYSVKEVIQTVAKITGKNILIAKGERRAGDAAILIADVTRIQKILAWQPKYSSLATIVSHAWTAIAQLCANNRLLS